MVVEGVGDLLTHMARCCKPVPPDPIVGYITRGRGITIHRRDCRVVQKMDAENRARLVDAMWAQQQEGSRFVADIHLFAQDRKGLLRDITSVFANAEISVLGSAVSRTGVRSAPTCGSRWRSATWTSLGR